MTKNQRILRRAVISGGPYTAEIAAAYDKEMALARKEEAIRRLRRAGHMPPSRRTVHMITHARVNQVNPVTPVPRTHPHARAALPALVSFPSLTITPPERDPLLIQVLDEISALEARLQALRATAAALRRCPAPLIRGDHLEHILKLVATHFRLTPADLIGRSKAEDIVWPRNIAIHLVRETTRWSSARIGRAFGDRDHGTVLWACRRVADRRSIDREFDVHVSTLTAQLCKSAPLGVSSQVQLAPSLRDHQPQSHPSQ